MDSTAPLEQEKFHTNLPTIEELLNPLLHTMHSLEGTADNRAIEEYIVQKLNISEELLSLRSKTKKGNKGKSLFSRQLGFAKTYLKDFGVLENPATGTWSLTQQGLNTAQVDPEEVKQAYEKQRRIRSAKRKAKSEVTEPRQDKADSNAELLLELQETLRERRRQRPEGSYTAELFAAGPARIAQKLGEESLEVIIAALHESRERQIAEVADLIAHLLILLVELEIPLEEILSELQRRHETRSQ